MLDTWTVDDSGVITHLGHVEGVSASDVSLALEGGLPGLLTTTVVDNQQQFKVMLWEINPSGALKEVATVTAASGVYRAGATARGWGTFVPFVNSNRELALTFWKTWWEGTPTNIIYHIDSDASLYGPALGRVSALRILPRQLPVHDPLGPGSPTDQGWITRSSELYVTAHSSTRASVGLNSWRVKYIRTSPIVREYTHVERSGGFTGLIPAPKPRLSGIVTDISLAPFVWASSGSSRLYPTGTTGVPATGTNTDGSLDDTIEFGTFQCSGTLTINGQSCSEQLGTDIVCTSSKKGVLCPAIYSGCTCSCSVGSCPNQSAQSSIPQLLSAMCARPSRRSH
jgi:hypothetical protein